MNVTLSQIEQEVQKMKATGAKILRVVLLKNPQRPQVITMAEFHVTPPTPNHLPNLLKSGRFAAHIKKALPVAEAEFFRVEDISSRDDRWS